MNYRHIFHAGNICDVVKHAVLALLLARLAEKEAPFCVLDTHAGIGLYDLHDPRAQKTGEAQSGILRFLAAPILQQIPEYYAALQSFNRDWVPGDAGTGGSFRFYPGSPFLARRMVRPQNRIIACELHEEDVETLRREAHAFDPIQIHHRDGYEAVRAFLPPAEKRGLAIIDPPYETPDEFEKLVEAVNTISKRWPQGMAIIWYPIKDRPALWRFHESLAATGVPRQLCAEFVYEEETRHDRLNGCGFIFINPPWQFDTKLQELFPALHQALQTPYHGISVNWLTEE